MRLPSPRPDGKGAIQSREGARRRVVGALQRIFGAAASVAASVVVWHSLAFVLQHHPALPIADGWAPWTSLRQILNGRTTPLQAFVARHNEHRILLTRGLFLLDLLDGGRDRISTAASLAFQAVQAGIWLVLLRWAGVGCAMGWLVLAGQGAAADRVLVDARAGGRPSASDLARIGVDRSTAMSDTALLRKIRAFGGIDVPSPHGDEAAGTLPRAPERGLSPRTTSRGTCRRASLPAARRREPDASLWPDPQRYVG